MEFQQIRYFVSVARELNFTRAAAVCRVAQPSLSAQIQKLERELGGPLFHRLGRRIRLTELGESLLPRAERMLHLQQETLHEASERAKRGGNVRFGATLTMAPYLIQSVAKWNKQNEMAVELEAHEDFTENLLGKLREGDLDFAVMSTPIEEAGMLTRLLTTEPFVAVLPEEHHLLKKKSITIQDLLSEDYLPLSEIHCAGKQINDLCRISSEHSQSKMQCAQIETILNLVQQGAGVTILPQMALATAHQRNLVFRNIEPKAPQRDIVLVHHQDRYLSPSARKLIAVVDEAAKNIPQFRS